MEINGVIYLNIYLVEQIILLKIIFILNWESLLEKYWNKLIKKIDVTEINKLFNNKTIKTVWNKEQEKYFISVVDIVGVVSESDNPRNYWKVLKHRLKQEGNESVTNSNQL